MKRLTDSLETKKDAIDFINVHDVWNASKLSQDEIRAYWVNLIDGFYSNAEMEEDTFYWSGFEDNAFWNAVEASGLTENEFIAALFKLADRFQ